STLRVYQFRHDRIRWKWTREVTPGAGKGKPAVSVYSAGPRAADGDAQYLADQPVRIDGFCDISVHACLDAPLLGARKGIRRHGDDRRPRRSLRLADFPRGLVAVH